MNRYGGGLAVYWLGIEEGVAGPGAGGVLAAPDLPPGALPRALALPPRAAPARARGGG